MDGLRPSVRPQPPSRRALPWLLRRPEALRLHHRATPSRRALPWLLRRPEALRLHHRATPSRRPRRAIPAANAEVPAPAAEAAIGAGLLLRAAATRGGPLRVAAALDDPHRLLHLRRRLRTHLPAARTNRIGNDRANGSLTGGRFALGGSKL